MFAQHFPRRREALCLWAHSSSEHSPTQCYLMQRKAASLITVSSLGGHAWIIAVIAAFADTNMGFAVWLSNALFCICLVSAVLLSGWTMFMPCWQFREIARTSWGQCRAGRGDLWLIKLQGKVFYYVQTGLFGNHGEIMTILLTVTYWRLLLPSTNSKGDPNPGADSYKYFTPWPHWN